MPGALLLAVLLMVCDLASADEPAVMRQMWMTPVQSSSVLSVLQYHGLHLSSMRDLAMQHYSSFLTLRASTHKFSDRDATTSDSFFQYQKMNSHNCHQRTLLPDSLHAVCDNSLPLSLHELSEKVFLPAARDFLAEIYIDNKDMPKSPTAFSWVSIHSNGTSHSLHHHKSSLVSGVLYVNLPNGSGDIVFHDPRGSLPPFGKTLRIPPKEGDLILFPGWLGHEVTPTLTSGPRISISFNLDGDWDTTGDVSQAFYVAND